jgi:frataxin
LSQVEYEKVCSETLESLCDYFEQLMEAQPVFKGSDIMYQDGVLTINLGPSFGTYVINRQSPNKQIWLSSPTSGPKRYDYYIDRQTWVYKHDGISLHKLLENEFSIMLGSPVDLTECSYYER